MADAIELVIEPRVRQVGRGEVQRLLPFRLRRMVGPFAFADHMGPEQLEPGPGVQVDAHPHIGLSTLTYLFAGRIRHRDSTGAVQVIEPGAVNWMTAGGGVCHTERSLPEDETAGGPLHGLQTWVALPTVLEDGPAFFEHHPAATIPEAELDGALVRVAAGTSWGLTSPVSVSSPLVLAEVRLGAASALAIDPTHAERAVLAVDAPLTLDGTVVSTGCLAVVAAGSAPVLAGTGRAMVLGGAPLGPRHIWWNFVHSDPARIDDAKRRWAEQRFPLVPGDHDPFTPLPA